MLGVIGKKIGMSIILKEKGISIPVTIIEVLPNRIVQIKTNKKDGYNAIQLYNGTGKLKKKKVETVKEFRISKQEFKTIGVNNGKDEITVSSFKIDEVVKVSGVSKGKGYQGTIKRWKFKSQNKSHGNSLAHRIAGSTGQCQNPGRVFKGKKMAGRMGTDKKTVKNLKIIKINLELNLIIIKGACPGFTGSKVLIKKIMKKKNEVKN
ncbi:50S ribosomal protein L3 [Candidatus Portiera aleyrodidarum]|uniref:50S ribosomal protein L3 n=1 Tax=Candidatus Portiera aleyrodidarum TaxID=91844 RepID=A0A6S6RW05_9GAMM|nr:50S ribosomal protein L3 [Candidatus Portiera aleyrodidarum]CAA3705394.1 50S ribosomal protein L3 [Candidatus Portiera aleyrodidarum]